MNEQIFESYDTIQVKGVSLVLVPAAELAAKDRQLDGLRDALRIDDEEIERLRARVTAAEALVVKWRENKSSGTFYTYPRVCADELEAALKAVQA